MQANAINWIGGIEGSVRGAMTQNPHPSQQISCRDLPLWMSFQWISEFSTPIHPSNSVQMGHDLFSWIQGLWDTNRGVMTQNLHPSQRISCHDLPLWMSFQWISEFSTPMHPSESVRWDMTYSVGFKVSETLTEESWRKICTRANKFHVTTCLLWMSFQWISEFSTPMHPSYSGRWDMTYSVGFKVSETPTEESWRKICTRANKFHVATCL